MERLEIESYNTNLNREAAKVSALLSSTFEKYESFAGEKSIITKIMQNIRTSRFTCLQLKKHLKNN